MAQTNPDASEIINFHDNNLSGEKRFLTIGRMYNKPYFRPINSDRILFYNQNGSEANLEIADDGFLYPRAGLIANYVIEKAGFWDASTSAEASVSGGNFYGSGPQSKTFGGGWSPTATGQYITLDLGTSVPINFITFGTFWATDPRFIPAGYTISYSLDNVNYVNLQTVVNNVSLNPLHSLGGVWGRYWRITINAFQPGQTSGSINGLKMLSTIGGSSTGNFWGAKYGSSDISFNAGGVSIATNKLPEGYKLAVNGAILTTKVKVLTYANWPDYVFEPTYRLSSLQDVELFIKQHKHLPDIPSAQTVGKEGLDLADSQALLLKKIEELTLYVIELKKENERQNEEIERLKERAVKQR